MKKTFNSKYRIKKPEGILALYVNPKVLRRPLTEYWNPAIYLYIFQPGYVKMDSKYLHSDHKR